MTAEPSATEVRRRVRPWAQGFDDGFAHLPQFAVSAPLGRPVEPEEIRGSFAAIESLAGWAARLMPADWRELADVDVLRLVARDLAVSAAVLQRALEDIQRLNYERSTNEC